VAGRAILALVLVVLVAAGCGVRNSKPLTAAASAPCLRGHGFRHVTTKPGEVGLIAAFADNGGLRATSPSGNELTVAFTRGDDGVESTEEAFTNHAPPCYRSHMSDIMSANRNAVLVWTTTPDPDELDTANRCLRS
jgi:hypothetical protein